MREFLSKKLLNLGTRLSTRVNDPAYLVAEASPEDVALMRQAAPYSMTHPSAQWSLIQALRQTHKQGLTGAFVECGVWKGGNLIIAGQMRKRLGDGRAIWGFDTFTGMSAPTEHDHKFGEDLDVAEKARRLTSGDITDWCYAPIEDVRAAWQAHVGDAPLHLVKGKVEDTLRIADNLPEAISVLRLDTDFYESTKAELEILYPRLQSGGVLIIDDYGAWEGARKATTEYFGDNGLWLHYVNQTVRLAIKP